MASGVVDQSSLDLTMIIFRGVVLVIAALGGCLSIFLGWKLYRDGLLSAVSGEASAQGRWTIRLSAAGPGVFFALFGMWLLTTLVNREISLRDSTPVQPAASRSVIPPGQVAPNGGNLTLIANVVPPPKTRDMVCYVAIRERHFADGTENITPAKITSDLKLSARYLRKVDRSKLSDKDEDDLDSSIATIDELAASTGQWRIQK
jgi:hypothetical protein